jgi:predicted ribosome quality control (RQC) complex YloA/Tae2 family protein
MAELGHVKVFKTRLKILPVLTREHCCEYSATTKIKKMDKLLDKFENKLDKFGNELDQFKEDLQDLKQIMEGLRDRHWKDHFKSDFRSDQDHLLEK